MQYSSTDGTESKIVQFRSSSVASYKQLFNSNQYGDDEVPPLYCAKLWGQFELFQQFRHSAIKLIKTNIEQMTQLKTDEDYIAQMTIKNCKNIKQYKRYEFLLEIYKNNLKCISINQTFIEKVENDTHN
jgi:hypothetical protein